MIGGFQGPASRLVLAVIVGTVGAAVFVQKPVRAADLGGDCCADLEERVAELEATTARKGNKKVSVIIYGKMPIPSTTPWNPRASALRVRRKSLATGPQATAWSSSLGLAFLSF